MCCLRGEAAGDADFRFLDTGNSFSCVVSCADACEAVLAESPSISISTSSASSSSAASSIGFGFSGTFLSFPLDLDDLLGADVDRDAGDEVAESSKTLTDLPFLPIAGEEPSTDTVVLSDRAPRGDNGMRFYHVSSTPFHTNDADADILKSTLRQGSQPSCSRS
jgi:hypothetical protein